MNVEIKNAPIINKPFVVAKSEGIHLWFYGQYDTADRALEVADMIGGIVLRVIW